MNTNEEVKMSASTEESAVPQGEEKAKRVEIPEVGCADEEFSLDEAEMKAATEREAPANSLRRGEILVAEDCEGTLKNFKDALKMGLLKRPEGLEQVSFHCSGFAKRDEGLAARQFTVTVKVNGKWGPLSRYAASANGGRFALGASQSLKAARKLADLVSAVWLSGMDLRPKAKAKKSAK